MTGPPAWQSTGEPSRGASPQTCYRHADRPTNIACTRCGNPICPDCMNAASVGYQCPSCVRQGTASVRRPVGHFGGRVQSGSPVTFTLIGLNVLVFLLSVGGQQLTSADLNNSVLSRLVLFGGHAANATDGSSGVAGGDYYRLLTACFVHFGVLHIASNMLVLYFVGPSLERVLGWWRFAAVYLISGLGGSVAVYVITSPRVVEGGASGAIFGLFAAYVVIGRKLRADLSGMLGTIGLNLVLTLSIPGISITGHLGGLATGALTGLVVTSSQRRTERQVGGFVAILVVLVVATLARTSALS